MHPVTRYTILMGCMVEFSLPRAITGLRHLKQREQSDSTCETGAVSEGVWCMPRPCCVTHGTQLGWCCGTVVPCWLVLHPLRPPRDHRARVKVHVDVVRTPGGPIAAGIVLSESGAKLGNRTCGRCMGLRKQPHDRYLPLSA